MSHHRRNGTRVGVRVEELIPEERRTEGLRCRVCGVLVAKVRRPVCVEHSPYAQSVAREAKRLGQTGWRGRDA